MQFIQPRLISHSFVLAAAFACAFGSLQAQPVREGHTLDRIVAIVGQQMILQSEVQTQIAILSQQTPDVDPNDPDLRERILDALIDDNLIISKAIEDSVVVSEDEITERLEFQIDRLVRELGSEKRIEEVYGMSISRIRRDFRDQIYKRLLAEKLTQTRFSGIKVSQREIEEFYAKFRDSIPPVPPGADIYHIVKYVDVASLAKEDVLKLALKVRDSIIQTGNFADFAARYSEDPGSASSGGDLGFVNTGVLVPEYEKAANNLVINEISQPVESPFGFHVIQLLDKNESAIHTRHILFKLGQSEDDVKRTKDFLDSLKRITASGSDFEELAKLHSDDEETKGFGGYLGRIELSTLPEDLRQKILDLPDGGVTEPLPYTANPTKAAFHIIYRKKFFPEHLITIDDDFKRLEQLALVYKRNQEYAEWVQGLRDTLYWEIKE